MKLVMFSKMLQEYSVGDAGDIIKGLGFDGVDLTVRPGGHVLPEKVKDDLEPAIETLRDKGLCVPMISTGLTSADDPAAEPTFEIAAACGVEALKLGYWKTGEFGTFKQKLEDVKKDLVGLATLAEKFGISANIHVHSGDFMSACAPVVYMLIEPYDPRIIGAYADFCHMGAEGSRGGWKQGLDLLGERINLVGVKNAGLFQRKDDDGTVRWELKLLPVWEGITPLPTAFGYLKQLGFDGTCSFHSEYQGSSSWKNLTTPELIEQTRKDLEYVKGVLAGLAE